MGLGVDNAAGMIYLAKEQAEPRGIAYRVSNAVTPPELGSFHLVTAVDLLNYATSKDQMPDVFPGRLRQRMRR